MPQTVFLSKICTISLAVTGRACLFSLFFSFLCCGVEQGADANAVIPWVESYVSLFFRHGKGFFFLGLGQTHLFVRFPFRRLVLCIVASARLCDGPRSGRPLPPPLGFAGCMVPVCSSLPCDSLDVFFFLWRSAGGTGLAGCASCGFVDADGWAGSSLREGQGGRWCAFGHLRMFSVVWLFPCERSWRFAGVIRLSGGAIFALQRGRFCLV